MKRGDQLRFRGPAGAEFVVTVGAVWDEKTIRARVDSGEWTPLERGPKAQDEPKPKAPARARKTAAKKTAAPKADE